MSVCTDSCLVCVMCHNVCHVLCVSCLVCVMSCVRHVLCASCLVCVMSCVRHVLCVSCLVCVMSCVRHVSYLGLLCVSCVMSHAGVLTCHLPCTCHALVRQPSSSRVSPPTLLIYIRVSPPRLLIIKGCWMSWMCAA
jgi:hypothetical protein